METYTPDGNWFCRNTSCIDIYLSFTLSTSFRVLRRVYGVLVLDGINIIDILLFTELKFTQNFLTVSGKIIRLPLREFLETWSCVRTV